MVAREIRQGGVGTRKCILCKGDIVLGQGEVESQGYQVRVTWVKIGKGNLMVLYKGDVRRVRV